MAGDILEYRSVPSPPTRKQRIASALNRISWMLLFLSILGIGAVFLFCPRKASDPFAGLIQKGSEIGPVINLIGAAFGISGGILKNPWSLVATLMHIFLGVIWPSIGFA